MGRPKKERKEIFTNIPHDAESQRKIKGKIQEIVGAMGRATAERDLIKEIGVEIEETTQFSKKVLKKLANIQYKANRKQVEDESDEILAAYDQLFKPKSLEGQP